MLEILALRLISICENPPGLQPSQARAGAWRDCYKLLFSLPPFAFRAPEKLTLNEVMFTATIKKMQCREIKVQRLF